MVDGVCCYDCHCISQTSGDRTKLTDWAGTAQLSSQLSWTPQHTAHQPTFYLFTSLTQPCHIDKTNYNHLSLFTETLLLEIFTSLLDSPPSLPCPAYIYSSAQLCL